MVIDGRSLSEADELEADACIVGAGPAGISIALELARTGARVCLLESGGKEVEAKAQKLNVGTSVGTPYFPLRATRRRAFGGTSAQWLESPADRAEGWRARPLDPIDFEHRPGIPYSGWPIGGSELRTYYDSAQRVCRLGSFDYVLASWEATDARALPLGGRIVTEMFQHGFETFESYLDEIARSSEITLVLHATALELETNASGSEINRIVVGRLPKASFAVQARLYVLAAGGIENARLLLLSRRQHPAGIGNGEDVVGRYFLERLSGRTGFVLPAAPEMLDSVRLYSQRVVGGTTVQGVLCPTNAVVRDEGLLNCAFFLAPQTRAEASEGVRSAAALYRALRRRPLAKQLPSHARNVLTGLGDIARVGVGKLRGSARPEILSLRVQAEQAPNPHSRITLDPRARDPFGLPTPRLDWRLTELDRWSIRRVQDILDEGLHGAGLGRVEHKLGQETPATLFLGIHHHMGTTRMHADPKYGVVGADCRVHGVSNLFIAGSSVFPTAGYSNPTLTVVALALRLADHLRTKLETRAA